MIDAATLAQMNGEYAMPADAGPAWRAAHAAGIDMSLRVVAHYFGQDVARATARHIEYPYPESDTRRIQI